MTARVTPALVVVDEIVQDLAAGAMDTRHAIAELRARGFTPDGIALGDAVAASLLRGRFISRQGNPYEFLNTVPTISSVNVWELAVERCEDQYSDAIRVLSKRAAVAS